MCRAISMGILCVVVAGCSGEKLPPEPKDPVAVQEAVLRHLLHKQPRDATAYLAVEGKDVSPALLARLRRDWPNLKPVSEEPKEKGLRFSVEAVKWIAPGVAEVHGGYWFPTKFAGEGYFADHRVVWKNGEWVFERVENVIMS